MNKRKILPFIYIIPGMILLIGLIYYPFLRNILYSFTNYALTKPNYKMVGLDNFVDALTNREFIASLRTTCIWVVVNMTLMISIGVLSAYIMNSKKIKGVFLLEIVLLVPWVLPEAITGYTWKLLLNYQSGIFYQILQGLHIIPEKYDIFAHTASALLACIAANVWRGFPLFGLTTLAKLRTLPEEQLEAALLDGASRWERFRYVEFPHIRSVVISVGTLGFIWTFNAYGIISVMTNGGPAKGTQVVSVLMQKTAFSYFDYSMASTYAILILLILIALILILRGIMKLFSYLFG